MQHDEHYMLQAIVQAKLAEQKQEVPVGAVIVLENEIIATGHNQSISTNDPTAHAEIIALRHAAKKIGNYRLINTTMYVTLEPCLMCIGAIVHARIKRLVYGATDPKTGAVNSMANMFDLPFLNHRVEYQGELLAKECGALLSDFFAVRR